MAERHLLINITIAWAPSEHLIVTPGTIDGWLRVNCQETKLVDLSQLLRDNRCLHWRCLVWPWQCRQFWRTEFCEQRWNIRECDWVAPEFKSILFLIERTELRRVSSWKLKRNLPFVWSKRHNRRVHRRPDCVSLRNDRWDIRPSFRCERYKTSSCWPRRLGELFLVVYWE